MEIPRKKLQASMGSLSGSRAAEGALALLDTETGQMFVSKVGAAIPRHPSMDGYVTSRHGDDADIVLSPDRLNDAIAAYLGMKDRISFSEEAKSADPAHAIQADALDVSGLRYTISDIDNIPSRQLCVLALALLAESLLDADQMIALAEDFYNMSADSFMEGVTSYA